MATSLPHTYKSISYEGRYLTLKVEEVSKDHANNRSKIKWTVTTVGGAVQYYDTYCSVSINGTQVANSGWILETNNNWNNWGNNVAKKGWQGSGTTGWITHGSDGKKNVTVSWTVGIFNWTTVTGTDTVALSQLDDDPPAVCEQYDIASINAYARTATASVIASSGCTMYWRWKVGSGSWTSWSNTNIQLQSEYSGQSIYHRPLSGLSYDTTYQFQFKAVKNTNGKSKESNICSFSIPGASTLNSANNIIVGDNISFTFNAKSKSSSYTHKIGLSVPGWTTTLGAISTSGQNITVGDSALTAAIRTLMQNRLTAATTASLYTYQTGTGQVGSHSSKTLTIRVDQNTSKPDLVADYRSTNEEAKLIQVDVDSLYITATATPKYGATLRSLTAKIGSRSINLTNGSETSWGVVTRAQIASGAVLTVTAEDSRGLKTSQEFALNIKVEHPQTLLKAEDFQRWYNILDEIYSGKYPTGNYYIGGSAKNFEVISVGQGDKATLTPIISNTKGICGAVDALQYAEDATTHQLFFYADPTVKAAIDNIIALEDWLAVGTNTLRLSGNTVVPRGDTESTITWDATNNEIDFTNGTNTNFTVSNGVLQITGTSGQYNQPTKIVKELKETLDTNMDIIDQVRIFNMKRGGSVSTKTSGGGYTWGDMVTDSDCPYYQSKSVSPLYGYSYIILPTPAIMATLFPSTYDGLPKQPYTNLKITRSGKSITVTREGTATEIQTQMPLTGTDWDNSMVRLTEVYMEAGYTYKINGIPELLHGSYSYDSIYIYFWRNRDDTYAINNGNPVEIRNNDVTFTVPAEANYVRIYLDIHGETVNSYPSTLFTYTPKLYYVGDGFESLARVTQDDTYYVYWNEDDVESVHNLNHWVMAGNVPFRSRTYFEYNTRDMWS